MHTSSCDHEKSPDKLLIRNSVITLHYRTVGYRFNMVENLYIISKDENITAWVDFVMSLINSVNRRKDRIIKVSESSWTCICRFLQI